jgi:phosphate transport system permease protein
MSSQPEGQVERPLLVEHDPRQVTPDPAVATAPAPPSGGGPASGLSGGPKRRNGDRIFAGLTFGASAFMIAVIVAIGVFLVWKAIPALQKDSVNFLTSKKYDPGATPPAFGVAALAFGTVLTSLVAVVLAVPVALGVSLYVTQYAHPRLARPVGYVVDLLAAVPSVVYGLWGLLFLAPRMKGLQAFLAAHFSWIPLFDPSSTNPVTTNSLLLVSVVLAVMILPIVTAICREVFVQVPTANKEAALALGATRLEMIRTAVLPYSRAGVISGIMLGLGRALGETIAVALTLSAVNSTSFNLLGNGNTIAANIANQFGESTPTGRSALIATGLVLFVITLVVNLLARGIIYRSNRLTTKGA